MKLAADNVQTVVIPNCGHFVPEEAPDETLAALSDFLDPYLSQPTASARG
jgi:pimeloyl-ACP methyl ester carboxylesterase